MASRVHPRAIKVMKEIGIDISMQSSKKINPDLLNQMDLIITLCGHAEASCLVTPPHIRRIHWPIDDPVGTEKEVLNVYRKARDEIKELILKFIEEVKDVQEIS
jgi:arsenate reductase